MSEAPLYVARGPARDGHRQSAEPMRAHERPRVCSGEARTGSPHSPSRLCPKKQKTALESELPTQTQNRLTLESKPPLRWWTIYTLYPGTLSVLSLSLSHSFD